MGLLEKAFRDMNLSRIHLNTLHNNTRAQRCFARCGFRACGEISKNGFNLIMMEIYRSQWQSPASSCGSETLKNDYPP
jgi:RimJ/RimL family protein N-acetyltransferase